MMSSTPSAWVTRILLSSLSHDKFLSAQQAYFKRGTTVECYRIALVTASTPPAFPMSAVRWLASLWSFSSCQADRSTSAKQTDPQAPSMRVPRESLRTDDCSSPLSPFRHPALGRRVSCRLRCSEQADIAGQGILSTEQQLRFEAVAAFHPHSSGCLPPNQNQSFSVFAQPTQDSAGPLLNRSRLLILPHRYQDLADGVVLTELIGDLIGLVWRRGTRLCRLYSLRRAWLLESAFSTM